MLMLNLISVLINVDINVELFLVCNVWKKSNAIKVSLETH